MSMSLIMLIGGDVYALITYCTVVESFFTTLSAGAVLWLRYKQPDLKRPIKVVPNEFSFDITLGFFRFLGSSVGSDNFRDSLHSALDCSHSRSTSGSRGRHADHSGGDARFLALYNTPAGSFTADIWYRFGFYILRIFLFQHSISRMVYE
jgi:amino acid transporter